MSQELETAIRDRTASEAELVELVRRAYGMSENAAIEHIGFVRGQKPTDTVRLPAPVAASRS